jgi:hypothetical protein
MSTLRVTFNANVVDLGDAVVPLDIIDAKLNQRTELLQLNQTMDLEVEPGSYLVRALLPSGEVVSAQVAVGPEQRTQVDLAPRLPSPRETLAWAYYLRGTGRAKAQTSGQETPFSALRSMSFRNVNLREGLARRFAASTEISKLDTAKPPEVRSWGYKEGKWLPLAQLGPPFQDTDVRQDDPRVLAMVGGSLALEQFWIQTQGPLYPPWIPEGRYFYRSKFTAMPPGPGSKALLMLDEVPGQGSDPLHVVARLSNPQAETILGYLTNGAFSAARQVAPSLVADAESLRWVKRADPASAAVAGYFLLLAGSPQSASAARWIQNLTEFAPWLPDGPVILAWYLLSDEKQPNVTAARFRFLEAIARGVPLFTRGLRLLFDGLNALRLRREGTNDAEVNQALERIRPYAAAADWRSATTSFYGEEPEKPLWTS